MDSASAASHRPPPPRAANIAYYSAAQGFSSIGSWMQRAGMGWLAWELTHSPGWVGALALTEVISALLISPLAGAMADRQSPYRVLMVTNVLMMVQAAGLGAYVWSGAASIWGLFGFALLDSILAAFSSPVRLTVVNQIAPRERLSQAIASNSMFFNLARVIGPAVAGAIMAKWAVYPVFLINAASYLGFMAVVVYLRPWIDRPASTGKSALIGDIVDGFRYIAGSPHIGTLFLLAGAVSLLVRPYGELLPAIAGEVFRSGPQGLSALMSALGAGAFVGAMLMLRRRSNRALLVTAFGSAVVLALTITVFIWAPGLKWAVPLMVLTGFVHVSCNIAMQSLAQSFADQAYRGRVMALYGLLFRAAPSLGAFLVGLAAEAWGLSLLLSAAAMVGMACIVAVAVRARRVYAAAIEPA